MSPLIANNIQRELYDNDIEYSDSDLSEMIEDDIEIST
jgi:hypothetical protein